MAGPMRSDQDHGNYEIAAAAAGKTRRLYNDEKKKKKSQTSEMTPW